eukprot:15403960-Alexandrium_andersonii.AAC.1
MHVRILNGNLRVAMHARANQQVIGQDPDVRTGSGVPGLPHPDRADEPEDAHAPRAPLRDPK